MKELIFREAKISELVEFQEKTKSMMDAITNISPVLSAVEETLDNYNSIAEQIRILGTSPNIGGMVAMLNESMEEIKAFQQEFLYEIDDSVLAYLNSGTGIWSYEIVKADQPTLLEMLRMALFNRLSSTLKSIEKQLAQQQKRRFRLIRDKRASFRAIVRLLFKNMDDEHDTVNNLTLNAHRSYLSLKKYYEHKEFNRTALQIGRAAA